MKCHGDQILGERARQEDAHHCQAFREPRACLAIVADGLGGHPAGDVASHEAVDAFLRTFLRLRAGEAAVPGEWVRESVKSANAHVVSCQRADPKLLGMGTTLVAAYVREDRLWGASVGDSYLLVLRDGRLIRLNELHVLEGALTSTIGNLTRVDVADGIPVQPGDRFLLATDGINSLDDEAVEHALGEARSPQAAVRALLDAIEARSDPYQDNATVVAVFA